MIKCSLPQVYNKYNYMHVFADISNKMSYLFWPQDIAFWTT